MNGTLLGQTRGSDKIIFLYDEKANRYGFDYNGTKYYYIFNVQGDVIGILNQSGTQIVSYQYDPWGKVLSVSGSEAATAATTTIPKQGSIIYSPAITIRLLEGSSMRTQSLMGAQVLLVIICLFMWQTTQ